ncbi:MAG: hypothetical protein J6T98_00230 [Salinivirgaceae bacterium]|nr:hypothetical protein [Salinivirgaceae bacterium]
MEEKKILPTSKEIVDGQLKMGHSLDWADLYADKKTELPYRNFYVASDVYAELASRDKEYAMSELKKHAESLLNDVIAQEIYVKMISSEGYDSLDIEKKSIQYSELYQQEIANGKTIIYAKKYAESITFEFFQEKKEEKSRLTAELYDIASKYGEPDSWECDIFIRGCVNCDSEDFDKNYDKMRTRYTKDWQREVLITLYEKIEKEGINYYFELPRSKKKDIETEMLDMMYPEGYDDDEISVFFDDDL